MSKITICEGDILWTSKKDTILHSFGGDMVFNAGQRNIWQGEKGIEIGKYEEMESLKDFPYGWWSYDFDGKKRVEFDIKSDKTGFRSHLEKTVYFQIEVNDRIPIDTSIQFQLYDYDTRLFMNRLNPDDKEFGGKEIIKTSAVREVDGKKRITIELFLEPKWKKELVEDRGPYRNGCLDFYWRWTYNNVDWNSENVILRVYASERTLYMKSAYIGYNFPEIRMYNGDIIVFSSGIGFEDKNSKEEDKIMKEIENLISDNIQDKILEKLQKYSDHLRHTIAVRQLKKGKLMNNLHKSEFSRRIYTSPVYDNSGKLYTITKAANFGYRKKGKLVTTKGISQIDYFREVGTLNKVLKVSKNVLKIFDFIDLAKYMAGEKPETIPMPFVPLDFITKLVVPQINEQIKEMWDTAIDEMVEMAKDNGIDEVKKIKYTNGGIDKGYDTLEIDQNSLNKLFEGGFNTLEELRIINFEKSDKPYLLLHHQEEDKDVDNIYDIIDCIFIK